ncbi:MAG: FtsX-like permease family protein [Gammaproteobacteria bacterium]|nr:FtsX-like permease family protein [Gammaproteobacteria bacterium]
MSALLLRKMLRDLWQRKGSLLALLVIMAVGVGAYVAMASVWRDLDGARQAYYREYRLADFIVDLKRVPVAEVEQIRALPNIDQLRGRVRQSVLLSLPGEIRPVQGLAISMPADPRPVLNDLLLRSGSWFSGEGEPEVILNHAFAMARGLKPGDRIQVQLLDQQHDMLIVGTAMSPEFVYLIPLEGGFAPDPSRFGVLYASREFLQQSSDLQGAWNQLIGRLHDGSVTPTDNMLKLLKDRLDSWGVTLTTPARDDPSVRYVDDELKGLEVQSRILPVLFLGVAALVLNVLLGRLVVQQRTIIGTFRALGYSPRAITAHYLAYGAVLGLLGGSMGIVLGLWIQGAMLEMYQQFFAIPNLVSHFYPATLFTGLIISLLFSLTGTYRGVRGSARLAPADAMRPAAPELGASILLERLSWFWGVLGFRSRMILRAIFRNPFRSLVSILAAAISTALIFSSLAMVDALDHLIRYEFEKIAHQDVTLHLREPGGLQQIKNEVLTLPGVQQVEPQLNLAADLANGPYEKRVGIQGLPRDNRLYTPLDGVGNPIRIPSQGLILTSKLAEMLRVQPGDYIRLRPLIGRRSEVEALIAGTVETYLGLSAYGDIHYLSGLLGETEAANSILTRQMKGGAIARTAEAIKQRPTVIGMNERLKGLHQLEQTFGETIGAMIGILVLFAGAIAFGSVLNSSLVSLSERQREVGTLRVLGYSPAGVSRIFSDESFLLNLFGLLLGLFLGIGLTYLLSYAYSTELYRFPAIILPRTLIYSGLLVMLFIGIAQWLVFRMIKRLNWLSVLNVKE